MREHNNFTFSVLNSSSPAVNKLVLLLLLFNFYFYFHFIIKIFCFVLKINEMNLFPVQWQTKKFDVLLSLYFQYKIIKVESKINKFMSFWRMALRGHYTSLNCWVQKNCFWNSILKKKKTAVNWFVQLGKSQAIFDRPNNYVFSNIICSFLLRIFPHALLERSKCTF